MKVVLTLASHGVREAEETPSCVGGMDSYNGWSQVERDQ